MNRIADFLFEAEILKNLPRAGYPFLGSGKESIAEHSFMTAFIAFTLSMVEPDVNGKRLVAMALIHDLPEARTGDLNYVQQKYVHAMEDKAISDMTHGLFFGSELSLLMEEFNKGETMESRLANDADQISFMMELKRLQDTGAKNPEKWLSTVMTRLKTDAGKKLAKSIVSTTWDNWWLSHYSE